MISFADLEKAYRVERGSPTLQKLAPEFYEEGRRLAESPDAGDFRKGILELLEKVYELRFNKIIHYAGRANLQTKPPDNSLRSEASLYARIMEALVQNRASVFDTRLETVNAPAANPRVKVRVKQALPAIAGPDGVEYGPFREDDVVELPSESAKLLIGRGIAEAA